MLGLRISRIIITKPWKTLFMFHPKISKESGFSEKCPSPEGFCPEKKVGKNLKAN